MKRTLCDTRTVKSLVEASGEGILVPPGLTVPSIITGSFAVGKDDVGALVSGEYVDVNFRLEYSRESGTYEIASFGLDRGASSLEISGALWRTVRVHSIVRAAIEMGLPEWARMIPRARFRRRDGILRDPPTYAASDPDGLLLTALSYRIAEITDENPALAVAELLGLKQRTATNWIARARAEGYLTTTDHEQEGRRIAQTLSRLIPFADWPRNPEEATSWYAHERVFLAETREHFKRAFELRWRAEERRAEQQGDVDGDDREL